MDRYQIGLLLLHVVLTLQVGALELDLVVLTALLTWPEARVDDGFALGDGLVGEVKESTGEEVAKDEFVFSDFSK